MEKYIISRSAFNKILKNLVRLEDEWDTIIHQFFRENNNEQSEMMHFIECYLNQMNQLLNNTDKENTLDEKIPFVTIGCEIEVENIFNLFHYKFKLISPLEDSIQLGDVSILTPLGRALLLKKVGSIVELNTSSGSIKYKIVSINI